MAGTVATVMSLGQGEDTAPAEEPPAPTQPVGPKRKPGARLSTSGKAPKGQLAKPGGARSAKRAKPRK